MKAPVFAYLCLAGSMAIVGANVAVGKAVIEELPIFVFSGLRFVLACLLLAPLALRKPSVKPLSVGDWRDLFLQSFFGVFAFTLLMLFGVSMTPASAAGVMTGSIPAAISLMAWLLLKERPNQRVIAGIFCASLGIVVLNLGGGGHESHGGVGEPHATLGLLLVGGAVISEALFTIFAKRGTVNVPPFRMAFYVNLIGLILFAPLTLIELQGFDPTTVGGSTWLLAGYYAVTASVISFLLWYAGVKHVPASQAGVFTAVMPVSSVAVAVFLLREPLTMSMVLGLLFVVAAVGLVTIQVARTR